ncbi:Recombination protein RecR [Fundidesulfovibrio magnetotacticus]|uniref:Recombination protein RecR n=1 Tax=Fundidesulfovibrio magnetotacticus TaxID=2730080 RepID=A0A6V8LZ88_9BACT|nr:recombination mediator RecR [Fundidesulfovibrio magnetotacticus]GFK95861.1 Recombination protein RecR [Fundidesulfovibrio magnetotacticus]
MKALPKPLADLVAELSSLPGLGPKSALRAALTLLKWPKARTQGLGRAIHDLRENLFLCSGCAGLAESDPCPICADPARHAEQLCLVSEWDSLLSLEETGLYKGRYLILGGLLSPLDGVDPGSLEFDRFQARLSEGAVQEVILALGSTLEAEATASFVKNLVERSHPGVRLTRLAQGIPLGAEVKYVDRETLKQSMIHRQNV